MFEDFFKRCKPADEVKPSKKRVSKNIAAVRSLIDSETEGISMTETKRKKRIKPLIIAAAAAVVLLLAGFTAVVRGKHVFSFNSGHSLEQAFDLDLKSRELTIPEEFMPQDDEFFSSNSVDMTPRELLEKFGITPPINDNFADVADNKPTVNVNSLDGDTIVDFKYVLYNKTIENNVFFSTRYWSYADNMTGTSHLGLFPGEPTEVITLKNGAKCMVSAWRAVFSYDGARWEFSVDFDDSMIPDNYGELSKKEQKKIIAEMIEAMPGIETVKQVLRDMELL